MCVSPKNFLGVFIFCSGEFLNILVLFQLKARFCNPETNPPARPAQPLTDPSWTSPAWAALGGSLPSRSPGGATLRGGDIAEPPELSSHRGSYLAAGGWRGLWVTWLLALCDNSLGLESSS